MLLVAIAARRSIRSIAAGVEVAAPLRAVTRTRRHRVERLQSLTSDGRLSCLGLLALESGLR